MFTLCCELNLEISSHKRHSYVSCPKTWNRYFHSCAQLFSHFQQYWFLRQKVGTNNVACFTVHHITRLAANRVDRRSGWLVLEHALVCNMKVIPSDCRQHWTDSTFTGLYCRADSSASMQWLLLFWRYIKSINNLLSFINQQTTGNFRHTLPALDWWPFIKNLKFKIRFTENQCKLEAVVKYSKFRWH
jgi:hypothetical protein